MKTGAIDVLPLLLAIMKRAVWYQHGTGFLDETHLLLSLQQARCFGIIISWLCTKLYCMCEVILRVFLV